MTICQALRAKSQVPSARSGRIPIRNNLTHLRLCACLFALGLSLLALCFPAEAQQPARIHRIGILSISGSVFPARVEAFRRRLRELGYIEGQNIVFEYRYAEGKQDRYA